MESLAAIRRFLYLVKVAAVTATLLALAGIAWDAHAQTACPTGAVAPDAARLCWRNATEFVDGTPIPATGPLSLSKTEIRNGVCTAAGVPSVVSIVLSVDATEGVAIFSSQPAGWQCWSARHQLVNGTFGNWGAWVRKELKAPVPPKSKAPTVTIE